MKEKAEKWSDEYLEYYVQKYMEDYEYETETEYSDSSDEEWLDYSNIDLQGKHIHVAFLFDKIYNDNQPQNFAKHSHVKQS